ncbi:MAG: hemolysin family protein [Rikenellaceae bacterium]
MDFVIIIIALVISAFFSGMELAYIASNRLRIEIDRKQSPAFDRIISLFLRHPSQYISTMLVGNNIALVVYSLFMSQVIAQYLVSSIAFETLISTVVIIIFAEFLPKGIVRISPNRYLRVLALPALLFYFLFYPITQFMSLISLGILRLFGLRSDSQVVEGPGIHDLQNLVDQSAEKKDSGLTIDSDVELQILQNVLEFPELKVRECMVPRVEIVAVDINSSPDQLLELFQQTFYSRIPLYRDSIDNIVGYASARNMFLSPERLEDIMQEILYVPSSGQIKRLLEEFIKRHKSMAVVIDEFGSTAGIITLEDILEEIVGEIEDEHDAVDEDGAVEEELSVGHYRFSARLEIDYINERYSLGIEESEEYETLAGYILYHSEELPVVGSTIDIGMLSIKILDADSNRISLVEISVG